METAVFGNIKERVTETVTANGVPSVTVTGVYPFDAEATFTCGQCFRFDDDGDGAYEGVAMGKRIRVSTPNEDTAIIDGITKDEYERVWRRYLGLDIDYAAIINNVRDTYGAESRIAVAANAGRGIRILRQDRWEALCSFIISQNNNIPRIKTIIERVCKELGEPAEGGGYAFPTAEVIAAAGAEGLAFSRMGFRAKYVAAAAKTVCDDIDFLDRVEEAPYDEADAMLRSLHGVGPKVSSCALLFGFSRLEAFPVDVWIRRTVGKYFDGDPSHLDFGALAPYAGILQQYIFHYERNIEGAS